MDNTTNKVILDTLNSLHQLSQDYQDHIPEILSKQKDHSNSLNKKRTDLLKSMRLSLEKQGDEACCFILKPKHPNISILQDFQNLLKKLSHQKYLDYKTNQNEYIRYKQLKAAVKNTGISPDRLITTQELEHGYQVFEQALHYMDDIKNVVDLQSRIHAIILEHQHTLNKLADYYQQESGQKPDISKLLTSMASLKQKFRSHEYEFISMLSNKLPQREQHYIDNLKKTIQKLSVGYHEYYQDQLYAMVQDQHAINPYISGIFAELQKKIDEAKTMHEVLQISQQIPDGMQKLYILHWVYETFFIYAHRDNKKRKLFTLNPNQDPTIGRAINGLVNSTSPEINLDAKNKLKEWKKDGVLFRNKVAHEGILYAPEKFQKAIRTYIKQGGFSSTLLKLSLENVPKKLPQRYNKELSLKVIEKALQFLTCHPKENQKNDINGFINIPWTHLFLNHFIKLDGGQELLYTNTIKKYYRKPAKNFGDDIYHEINQILARHFSKLFSIKESGYNNLHNLYRAARKKQGIEDDYLSSGFKRALYMAGRANNLDDKVLSYHTWGHPTNSSHPLTPCVRIVVASN